MGGGVRAVEERPGASCNLMNQSPSSFQCYRFWPWAIAGRWEYPRRTGGNEQGLGDPPGSYDLSCLVYTSTNSKKKHSGHVDIAMLNGIYCKKCSFDIGI